MGRGSRQVLQAVPVLVLAVALVGCAGGLLPRDIGIASRSYGGIPAGIDSPFSSTTVRPVVTEPPLSILDPDDLDLDGPATTAPSDGPVPTPDPDFLPRVAWLDEDTLAVVTFGSSSCPAAPSALTVTAPEDVLIELMATGGPNCTADLGPTTFEIDDPDDLDPSRSYNVSFGGDDGTTVFLEPFAE